MLNETFLDDFQTLWLCLYTEKQLNALQLKGEMRATHRHKIEKLMSSRQA